MPFTMLRAGNTKMARLPWSLLLLGFLDREKGRQSWSNGAKEAGLSWKRNRGQGRPVQEMTLHLRDETEGQGWGGHFPSIFGNSWNF